MSIKSVDPESLTEDERIERIKLVDKLTLSPSQRATRVHKLLDNIKFPELVTAWDMICFCGFYLSYTFSKDSGMLYEALKRVLYCINQFHYFYTEDHEEEERKKLDYFAKVSVKKMADKEEEKVWTAEDFKIGVRSDDKNIN
jgi:hypothetical protein